MIFWRRPTPPRATVTKLGRTLAFADIVMTVAGSDEPVAQAATVYALLG